MCSSDLHDSEAFGGDDLNDLDPGCWDTCQDGLTQATAGASCAQILSDDPSAADGSYWLDFGGATAFETSCDMTTDGGGWTCLARWDARGLWVHKGIWFSRHGSLLETLAWLIEQSSDGRFASELEDMVRVRVQEALRTLYRRERVLRHQIGGQ